MNDSLDSSRLDLRRCAFFFDVDGTLAEIQPRPESVFIPPITLAALTRLKADGVPVAVVSGRRIVELDQLLAPLRLPAAGIHGAERRTASGETTQLALDDGLFSHIHDELLQACAEHSGLRLENKGVAFALHFRLAPELESVARALAEDYAHRYAEALTLQPGKCVFELKPRGASKGEVIKVFMNEAPFKGRQPVFVGDDLTDEAGFAAVNALDGLSVKVGGGPTVANHRLDSVAAVAAWLNQLLLDLPASLANKTKSD